MRRCLRWLLHFLLLLPLLLGGANVAAARRALLIGVSELPGQPAANWLQAPRNDVRLMQRALLAQGWQPSTIQTLADGVPGAGSPDMSAIHAALGHLLAQSVPGDFVLLYFSGHGARVLDFHKQYREPDGLAEMFLARDGALRDVEIGRWVQAFLARGAFVWAVFDTCSAASMTRGGADTNRPPMPEDAADDPVRFRGLELGQLSAVARKRALAPIDVGVGASDDTLFVPPARYVAFFAAESHQTTPELRLPRGQFGAETHGLLTWSIAEALHQRPSTWRALFNDVLMRYAPVIDELEQRFPTRELPSPVAEGSLDVPLFESVGPAASTQPAWPARRQGAGLVVSAGLLDGVQPDQAVRVSAILPGGRAQDGIATVDAARVSSARVRLPPALLALPGGTFWQATPLGLPDAVALRIHAGADLARRALSGMSLSYPASVLLVDAQQQADLSVEAHGAEFIAAPVQGGPARRLPDAAALRRHVADLATRRWLMHLIQVVKAERPAPLKGFEVRLRDLAGTARDGQGEPLAERMTRPSEGAAIEVENRSGGSVDLLMVGLTADGGLAPVFPVSSGETNRFERGDATVPARKRFALPSALTVGGGALLVLATPARPRSPPRLYGLSPPSIDELPGVVRRGGIEPDGSDAVFAVLARW
ncbi:caspase family protein [Ottowia pentelensis]|uniref:Caspase family protein n=1 Tax=Ottowia pentelensis TaxID=511108 RepID=A0ABV6PN49_9BURK